MRCLLIIALLCAAVGARAADRKEIEPCAYRTDAEAAAAWKPLDGSGPVSLAPERTPDRRPALAFRCDMTRVEQRSYWDRAVPLDLAPYGRIAFWIRVEGDPSAIAGATLYFNAGGGWYGAPFGSPEPGWRRITLDRGAFQPEDAPEGWGRIRAIRIAFWKGQPRACAVYMGGLEAFSSDVVVVRNTRAGREAATWTERMAAALASAGVDAGTVDDTDVEGGVLAGKRIALYPFNPQPSDREMDALEAFVKAGGRVVACFMLPPRMAALLGVEDRGYMPQERAGQFSVMKLTPGRPPGLPAEVRQASWNIQRARPAGKNARVLAEWYDREGKDTGYPALLLSDTGAFLTHVLLSDDPAGKERLLRGLLGHLWPGLWETLAKRALTQVGGIGADQRRYEETEAAIRETARASERLSAVQGLLAESRRAYVLGLDRLLQKDYPAALEAAAQAREKLLAAWAQAQAARAGEFRAVWCHDAYGVEGMTWDQAMRHLKENGFNAVVPNMLWGGVADYASEVLPVRDRVAKEGDQITRCVAAGRKYGVQVHVWKVNWNLQDAPESFVAKLRAEGRLQRTNGGQEEAWLCPSHPANFALERDAMLEVARKYDVDGIHFDYIRYPDSSKCYCDGCRARFEVGRGGKVARWPQDVLRGGPDYAAYQEFRRANITRLVQAVSEEAHRLKPWLRVSAAVFPNWPQCREEVGQDWGRWVREGWLDFVCPMDYTASDSEFRTRVQVQRDEVNGRIPLYPGIGASAPGLPTGQVIDQVRIARREGADGFILFNYDATVSGECVPALGHGATAGPTAPPHDAPVILWQARVEGQTARIEATVTTRGAFREPPRAVEAVITLCAPDDTVLKEIRRGAAGGPAITGSAPLPQGLCRPVARGTVTLADGTRRAFVARGPFLRR